MKNLSFISSFILKNSSSKLKRLLVGFIILGFSLAIMLLPNVSFKDTEQNLNAQETRPVNQEAGEVYRQEEETRKLVKEGKVLEAFDLVASYYTTASSGSSLCHGLTHIIGEETYDLFARKIDFEISPKSAYCAYGFYHGFMEKLVQKTNDLKKASEFCSLVDQKLAAHAADAQLQCYHGIGHGTATFHAPIKGQDEETILKPALKLCEEVSANFDQLYRCASGSFNAIALYYLDGSLEVDRNDPLKLCRNQEDKYKESCFGNMNVLLVWLVDDNLKEGSAFIEKIPEDIYAIPAIRYFSAIVSSREKHTTDSLVLVCRSLQKRLQIPCVEGIVHGIIEHGSPGLEYVAALEFCKSPPLREEEKSVCFENAVNYFYSIYPKDKVAGICEGLEDRYAERCEKYN